MSNVSSSRMSKYYLNNFPFKLQAHTKLCIYTRYFILDYYWCDIFMTDSVCTTKWMDAYETTAKFNIAETCAASISIEDLQKLSESKSKNVIDLSTKLVYGEIRGSENLRANLSRLYSAKTANPLPSDNILITPGAIAANFLLLYTLIEKGDHVICHYPTYQQLYTVPASLGADVSLWKAQEDKKWQLDIQELKDLIRPNTKMIIIK